MNYNRQPGESKKDWRARIWAYVLEIHAALKALDSESDQTERLLAERDEARRAYIYALRAR